MVIYFVILYLIINFILIIIGSFKETSEANMGNYIDTPVYEKSLFDRWYYDVFIQKYSGDKNAWPARKIIRLIVFLFFLLPIGIICFLYNTLEKVLGKL